MRNCYPKSLQHFFIILSGVRLCPFGTAATTGLLHQPQMIDDGDCGAIGGISRRNGSTRRKPAPAPICPLQIAYDQTQARTWTAAVGSQRLTACAMARPLQHSIGEPNVGTRAMSKPEPIQQKLQLVYTAVQADSVCCGNSGTWILRNILPLW
jgi:hypothetical protein